LTFFIGIPILRTMLTNARHFAALNHAIYTANADGSIPPDSTLVCEMLRANATLVPQLLKQANAYIVLVESLNNTVDDGEEAKAFAARVLRRLEERK
jgi:hypothetical protein